MRKLYSLKKLHSTGMTRVILFLMAVLLMQQVVARPVADSSRPVIRSFTPASGQTGTTIAISGAHFTGAVDVSFGGVSVDSFTVAADSLIHALVGNGASGVVRVTTPFGTDTACCFTYIRDTVAPSLPPDITGFRPQSGRTGATVSIFGSHFTGAFGVSFGHVDAASFTVVADTLIHAVVGNGASGFVYVATPFGIDSLGGFTYIRDTIPPDSFPPDIITFSPKTGRTGTVVNIFGTHFRNTSGVGFGGVSATSFTVVSDSLIQATVGNGASGFVRVSTRFGTDSLGGFTYIRDTFPPDSFPPDIITFNPKTGRTGTVVNILGTHFRNTIGVSFGSVSAASFTVLSDSLIRATVGNGASGFVRVSTRFGTDSLGGFTYIRDTFPPDSFPPDIITFNPKIGRTGTVVNIFGTHFNKTTSVSFGGVSAASFTVLSDSLIRATVGNGASGFVRVSTRFGTDSLGGFTYIRDTFPPDSFPPDIITFNPKIGRTGTVVNIFGTHFNKTTSVSFGGVSAASFTVLSDSLIRATVGNGASGFVRVSTRFGTDSLGGFTYIRDSFPPDIISFSPTSGTTGTVVTINGTGFTAATQVSFGGIRAASFTVYSDSVIKAVVDTGATGAVRVRTANGSDTLGTFTYVPVITVRVNLAPNPANGFTIVTHPAIARYAQLKLADITGNVVRTVKIAPHVSQTRFNLGGVNPGVYKLNYSDGSVQYSLTLLIQ